MEICLWIRKGSFSTGFNSQAILRPLCFSDSGGVLTEVVLILGGPGVGVANPILGSALELGLEAAEICI